MIEIAVGEETDRHQTHTIASPMKVAFFNEVNNPGGIVEIEEENGTKTLVHIIQPMPMIIDYAEYSVIAAEV